MYCLCQINFITVNYNNGYLIWPFDHRRLSANRDIQERSIQF